MCTEPGTTINNYVANLFITLKVNDFCTTARIYFWWLTLMKEFYTTFQMTFVKFGQNEEEDVEVPAPRCRGRVNCQTCHAA